MTTSESTLHECARFDPRNPHIRVGRGSRIVYLLDPKPEDMDIVVIGTALSRIQRFGAHGRGNYSVALHSANVAETLYHRGESPDVQLWGLLHDAAEAFIGDIVSPLKRQLPEIYEIEGRFQAAIAARFRLPLPIPPVVLEVDREMVEYEAHYLFPNRPDDGRVEPPPAPAGGLLLYMRGEAKNFAWFLDRFSEICERRGEDSADYGCSMGTSPVPD